MNKQGMTTHQHDLIVDGLIEGCKHGMSGQVSGPELVEEAEAEASQVNRLA